MKVSALLMRIEAESDMKSKRMQDGLEVLNEPKMLYEEMVQHVEQTKTPLEFLKKEASLRARAEKLVMLDELGPEYKDYVSHGKYLEELLTGFDVKKMGKVKRKGLVRKISQVLKVWKSDRKHFDPTAYRSLDLMLTKIASLEQEQNNDSDNSLSWELESSSEEDDEDPSDAKDATTSKHKVLQRLKCNV